MSCHVSEGVYNSTGWAAHGCITGHLINRAICCKPSTRARTRSSCSRSAMSVGMTLSRTEVRFITAVRAGCRGGIIFWHLFPGAALLLHSNHFDTNTRCAEPQLIRSSPDSRSTGLLFLACRMRAGSNVHSGRQENPSRYGKQGRCCPSHRATPPSSHRGAAQTLAAELGAQARLVSLGHQLLAGHQASIEAACWNAKQEV